MNESTQGTSVLRQRMIEDMRMRKPGVAIAVCARLRPLSACRRPLH
jgi:hypothetical protein